MSEAERARAHMIDSQIRTADVTDPELVAAFRAVPREAFLPGRLAAVAYGDLDLEIAPGRFAMRPRDLAKLIQALAPSRRDRALEIGAGYGYGAAVLSHVCGAVTALEPDADLSRLALSALAGAGLANIPVVSTAIERGWPDGAPYDVILVSGGVEVTPEAWIEQLAEGGRLGVIVRSGPAGTARVYVKSGGRVSFRTAFDAAPAILPGLEKPAGFRF